MSWARPIWGLVNYLDHSVANSWLMKNKLAQNSWLFVMDVATFDGSDRLYLA